MRAYRPYTLRCVIFHWVEILLLLNILLWLTPHLSYLFFPYTETGYIISQIRLLHRLNAGVCTTSSALLRSLSPLYFPYYTFSILNRSLFSRRCLIDPTNIPSWPFFPCAVPYLKTHRYYLCSFFLVPFLLIIWNRYKPIHPIYPVNN